MAELTPAINRRIRIAANAIVHAAKKPTNRHPKENSLWGVVASIQSSSMSLTIALNGNTTNEVAHIKYASSYSPTVGDTVYMVRKANDYFVLTAVNGNAGRLIQIGHTYALQGPLVVGTGAANDVPPFRVPVTGMVKLVRVVGATLSNSCTIDIKQNGSGVSGLTGLSVTTSATTFTPSGSVTVADLDSFDIVITAISGSPNGLGLTFCFDVTP
jgi:hypothetical protein